MLSKLRIRFFRSHKSSVLDFSEGLNVITGTSDAGKSVIVNALNWVLNNRPRGFSFRSDFASRSDMTSVFLGFSEGSSLKRIRDSKHVNRYDVVPKDNGVPYSLEAMKGTIPSEVGDVSRISSYSMQRQHDPYFLLQLAPGDAARMINKVIGIDLIDKVMRKIDSSIRHYSSSLKMTRRDLIQAKEEKENLKEFPKLRKVMSGFTKNVAERELARQGRKTLGKAILELERTDRELADAEVFLNLEPDIVSIHKSAINLRNTTEMRDQIKEAIGTVKGMDKKIVEADNFLVYEKSVFDLTKETRSLRLEKNEKLEMTRLINEIVSMDYSIREKEQEREKLEKEFHNLMKGAGVCPYCERPF